MAQREGNTVPNTEDVLAELEKDRLNAILSFAKWAVLSILAMLCIILAFLATMSII